MRVDLLSLSRRRRSALSLAQFGYTAPVCISPSKDYSMRRRQIVIIARFTMLEAARTRLFWLFGAALVLVFGATFFIQQLAIIESTRLQIEFSAAATRLAAVFVLCLHVLSSIVREFNDKGLELTLSFDLRRSDYVLGRLLGFGAVALPIALMATLPQLLLAPLPATLQWGLSLALELMIMAALSVFCIVTFTQLIPAAAFVSAFYLLARALSAIRLISATPIIDDNALSHQIMSWLVEALALVVPALDRYAAGAWLADGAAGWPVVGANAAQAALYVALLGAAAMFDFHRRNL
jgi:ABC-type transport system involved in multi-copper enzyme maturation permease subunit